MTGGWDGIEEVVAAHQAGSFAAGSRALGISTSQMSRAIARLEERLGTPLFFRTTRRITTTDTGRVLIEQFRQLLRERDEALAMAGNGEVQGLLRVTCAVALGERYVAPIIRSYAAEHPRLEVQLDLTNRLVDMVSEGYDLAVRTGNLANSNLVATRIASRRLLLGASPSYLANRGIPESVADLATHDCVIGSTATWHFTVDGVDSVHRPKGRWQCNSGTVVTDAIAAGMGVGQLPEFYLLPHIANGSVVTLLDAFRPAEQPIWAVYPQRRHMLPKVSALVERLRATLSHSISGAEA